MQQNLRLFSAQKIISFWTDTYHDTVPCHRGILNSIEERNEQHQGSWEENPTTSEYQKKWTGESSNKCYERF